MSAESLLKVEISQHVLKYSSTEIKSITISQTELSTFIHCFCGPQQLDSSL